MSTPTRTPLARPDEFPDAEVLVGDILAAVVDGDGVPLGPRVDTTVPETSGPAAAVYAPPGRSSLNGYGDVETTFIYFDFVAPDRDAAKAMADQARRLLEEFKQGGLHKGVQIYRIGLVTTPTELPLRYPDDPRHREGGCQVLLRRHRGQLIHP